MNCKGEDCDRVAVCQGFCDKHYRRWKKFGDPSFVTPHSYEGQECSVEECTRRPRSDSLCGLHYQRWRKYGDPLEVERVQVSRGTYVECLVANCGEAPHGRGLCDKHYKAWQREQLPEYAAWQEMKRRCFTPSFKQFKDYGGRGITVAPVWLGPDGFANFYEHVGSKPSPELTLDRVDNDGNYEPGNVRWATRLEQANNKRNNVRR